MTGFFLGITFVLLLIVVVILAWLLAQHFKLKQKFFILAEHVDNHNRDLVGLCSVTVAVENALNDKESLIKDLEEKLVELHQQEEKNQPYQNVIQHVRKGLSINELVQDFGMSRDEAALLIRLHGPK